ncbi:hypothetical protein [Nocardia cyriacigeorgica]|uniref:hypothetical protein n=1 Tax=Nocardia cyriacigeorgica TaxID=135487 RepID=UPI0002F11194|nr:hypothetical protein [Nocardia cyriacigeorgica]
MTSRHPPELEYIDVGPRLGAPRPIRESFAGSGGPCPPAHRPLTPADPTAPRTEQ